MHDGSRLRQQNERIIHGVERRRNAPRRQRPSRSDVRIHDQPKMLVASHSPARAFRASSLSLSNVSGVSSASCREKPVKDGEQRRFEHGPRLVPFGQVSLCLRPDIHMAGCGQKLHRLELSCYCGNAAVHRHSDAGHHNYWTRVPVGRKWLLNVGTIIKSMPRISATFFAVSEDFRSDGHDGIRLRRR